MLLLVHFSPEAAEIHVALTPPPPPPSTPSSQLVSLEVPTESPAVKSLRKLEKKLKAIEELKEKRDRGVKLEKSQVSLTVSIFLFMLSLCVYS